MSTDYDSFKSYAISILDLAFFTNLCLFLVGFAFYLAILPKNVQNTLPLILVLFLGVFSWTFRSKMNNSENKEEIKPFLIQWLIISMILIVFSIFITLIYPIS